MLEGISPDGRHSLLDLGHAAGSKVDLFAPYARRMRFLDLLEGIDRELTGKRPASWDEAVAGIPVQAEHPYDLILGWDILDRMPESHHAALVQRLAGVSAPGARLHLLVDASAPGRPSPGWLRFTPVAADRMRVEKLAEKDARAGGSGGGPGAGPGSRPGKGPGSGRGAAPRVDSGHGSAPGGDPSHRPRRLQPAQVERLLLPFRVVRGFTLKLGLREFVAVRRD